MRNGEVSFWWQARGGFPPRRPSLPGPTEADVCIVGGGYTGLWTAYYLARLRPGLRIVVLEAAFAGYGASGRNGGWVTAELPGSRARYARAAGGAADVAALEAELRSTVDEVGRVCAAESIGCDFVKGGRLSVATTPSQLARMREGLTAVREHGDGDDVYQFLSRDETRERVNVAGALGGLYAP
ncbi:MAG: NAD(P)/FAD-dependent oxidoreductase, partial [Trebonia sp.]